MKLLFLALVVLIGGTAFLVWHGRGGRVPSLPSLPFVAARKEAPKPTAPPVNPKATQKSLHAIKTVPTVADAALDPQPTQVEASAPPPIAAARPTVARPHLPFPAADKIAVGAITEAVTGQYGDPSAWAVAAEDGHIVETLVYLRERTGPATVIRIVDGRVAAAYAKTVPPSPQGSLIRNFGLQN